MSLESAQDQTHTVNSPSAEKGRGVTRLARLADVALLPNAVNIVGITAALVALALSAYGASTPIRLWITVVAFTVGPGSGLVLFLGLGDAVLAFGLAIAVSLALDIVVGQSLLWTHALHGTIAAAIILILSLIRPIGSSHKVQPTAEPDEPTQAIDEPTEELEKP